MRTSTITKMESDKMMMMLLIICDDNDVYDDEFDNHSLCFAFVV